MRRHGHIAPLVIAPLLALALPSVAAIGAGIAGATAGEISFALPVDCAMGTLCTVQKYFDHDPGNGRIDYACGRLSLDGDIGTDIRVPDLPAMARGVWVLAAAPGRVKAVRDGMADVNVNVIGRTALAGRDAGNAVVIDNGGGWETQYSHLRQGSVAVAPGMRVEAGARLGLIGLSGNTEFPHVEFAVRFRGEPVDPFVGRVAFADCHDARAPLWSAAALAALPYRATWALSAGFATARPDAALARAGAYAARALGGDSPALVFWVDISGAQAGDVQRFEISDPAGRTILMRESTLEKSFVSWFAFAGLRRPDEGWRRGRYTARYTLSRGATTVAEITRAALIATAP